MLFKLDGIELVFDNEFNLPFLVEKVGFDDEIIEDFDEDFVETDNIDLDDEFNAILFVFLDNKPLIILLSEFVINGWNRSILDLLLL